MRMKLLSFAVFLLWLAAITNSPAAAESGRRSADQPPNVVLIVADDLGYGEVGCYGQKWIQTPNIDKMADEGMKFTRFYCGQAVCAPSRCSLLTGMHQGHAWIRNNGNPAERGKPRPKDLHFPGQHPIPESSVTIAKLLKSGGYATGAMGKWGLGPIDSSGDPNNQGFDLFYGFNCQVHAHNHYPRFLWRNDQQEILPGNDRSMYGDTFSQDRFRDVALEFVRQHQDGPFFLYLPFAIPHLAIQIPDESLREFRGKIPEADYEHRGYLPYPEPRAGYAAMISHMDRDIGKILALLDELGIADNTLVMFTSDNGPTYDRLGGSDSDFFESAGPLRGRKGSLLEGGIRVPLVARWPGQIAPGKTTGHMAAFWDLLPTICQAAGVNPPNGIDGISFLPTLTGTGQQETHDFLYWEFPGYGGQQAVRRGQWKAIRQKLHEFPDAPFQLYNLATDIDESDDVAAEHPDVVAMMEEICRQSRVPSELFPFAALDK